MKKLAIILFLLPITLQAQQEKMPKLSKKQYEILNLLFPGNTEITLARYTSFPLHLSHFLTNEYFTLDGGFCALGREDIPTFAKSELWEYLDSEDFEKLIFQSSIIGKSYEIEKENLTNKSIELVDQRLINSIYQVSTPLIQGDLALIQVVHGYIEMIIILQKNQQNEWQKLCEVFIQLNLAVDDN